LHFDSTAHSVDAASELDKHSVSRPLEDTAVMQRDGGIDQIAEESVRPRKRPLLIGTGKLAVSGDICRQNCTT